jgi:hypothetical protein
MITFYRPYVLFIGTLLPEMDSQIKTFAINHMLISAVPAISV